MDNLQKFISDAEKAKKHAIANNGGNFDAKKVSDSIAEIFIRNNRNMQAVAEGIADYWQNNYSDPNEESIKKLASMQAVLDSTEGDFEGTEALSDDDWKELCQIVNAEAEDLPLDNLNNMMMLFVDKQVL